MSRTTQNSIIIIRRRTEKVSPRKFWRNIFCFCQFWVHTAQPSRSGSKIGGALVHNEMRTSLFYSLDFSPVENIARLWYQPGVRILSLELCLNLALLTGGGGWSFRCLDDVMNESTSWTSSCQSRHQCQPLLCATVSQAPLLNMQNPAQIPALGYICWQ